MEPTCRNEEKRQRPKGPESPPDKLNRHEKREEEEAKANVNEARWLRWVALCSRKKKNSYVESAEYRKDLLELEAIEAREKKHDEGLVRPLQEEEAEEAGHNEAEKYFEQGTRGEPITID